ncbi:unnamed protein product [Clavelina lepadiformis]|uniref:SAP30-binding protein n=1 Tax=Clavelina lepadiformis TaxID=159417 RepID=A0ABP0FRD7_CLALP
MAGLSALAQYEISDEEEEGEEINHHETEVTNGLLDQENGGMGSVKVDEDESEPKRHHDEDDIVDDIDMENMIVSDEEEHVSNESEIPAQPKFKRYSCESATVLAEKLQKMSEEEARLPPEPDGKCSKQLQDKIKRLYEKKIKEGENLNQVFQERKDFRNPSIYDKLILFLNIEERGTNFPKCDYDPSSWRKVPDYEDLARAQREDVAKKEREKKTKVEFVTGTVKKSNTSTGSGDTLKKSKWDKPADDAKAQTITATKIPPSAVPSAKTTIISARLS